MSKKDRDALRHKMEAKWSREQDRNNERLFQVEKHPERYPNKYEELEKLVKQ